jgi:hypothetical protein
MEVKFKAYNGLKVQAFVNCLTLKMTTMRCFRNVYKYVSMGEASLPRRFED